MLSTSAKLFSGDLIPRVGLGTGMSDDIEKSVLKAIELGYRHIDTAYVYNAENDIGKALNAAFTRGLVKREDMFIVSKLPSHGHSIDKVKHFLKQSLSSLQLSYVDLYLIHQPCGMKYLSDDNPFPIEDGKIQYMESDHVLLWKEMERMVEEGLARNIGLSNFNSKQFQRVYDLATIKPAVLQVECHLYFQQEKLLKYCQNLGVCFVAYSPFGSPMMPHFVRTVFKTDYAENPKILEDPILNELAEKYSKSTAQLALRWLIQRGMVAIPKSSNPARLAENLTIFDFEIVEEDMIKLKSVDRSIRFFDFKFSEDCGNQLNYPFKDDVEF